MADSYEVVRGSLKLKGVADGGVNKKKKKKNKAKQVIKETARSVAKEEEADRSSESTEVDNRTLAQKAYDKINEKRAAERILKKAEKTHKQRVEKFNEYLDDLTEHYDIPKVSWTK